MGSLANAAAMSVSGAPGTGLVTLAAAKASYLDFATAGCVDGATYSYVLKDGNNREGGFGTYNAVGTFSRDTILFSTAGGTTPINATASATIQISPLSPDLDPVTVATVATFQNRGFDKYTQSVKILGYTTTGKGAFSVRRTTGQAAHGWTFRSKDRYLPNMTTNATTGGWWEGYPTDDHITIEAFGAPADGISDDYSYFYAANKYLIWCAQNNVYMPDLFFPAKFYKFSSTLWPGADAANPSGQGNPIVMRGTYTPQRNGTRFTFPADTCGIFVSPNAYGLKFDGIALIGAQTTGQAWNAHGISVNTGYVQITNFNIAFFSSHGIQIFSGGVPRKVNVTAASGNGVTATLTYANLGHLTPLAVGNVVTVQGVRPTGYNGSVTITGATSDGHGGGTISYANTTTGALTYLGGTIYSADPTWGQTNSDQWYVAHGVMGNIGRWGMYVDGSDSTLGLCHNVDINGTGCGSILDAAYFENIYHTIQGSFGGVPIANMPQNDPTWPGNYNLPNGTGRKGGIVQGSNGYQYILKPGLTDESVASFTDPVTDTTQTVWYLYKNYPDTGMPGGGTRWPTWASGDLYSCGMQVYTQNATFDNFYCESGSSYFVPGVFGAAGGGYGNGTIPRFNGAGNRPAFWQFNNGAFQAEGGIISAESVPITNSAGTIQANFAKTFNNVLGGTPEVGAVLTTQWNLSGAGACTFRQCYDPTNHELFWEGAPGHIFFRMAGDGGLNTYNRTLAYSFALNIPYTLLIGNGLSTRQIVSGNFSGSTPPTDGGGAAYDWRPGDMVMNPAASIGGVGARICTLAGVGAAAVFAPIVAGPINQVEYTVSTAPSGGPPPAFTLAAANCVGGLIEVKIILSATLSANSNVLLPTVTDLVTALGAFFYDGMTFVLTIANASSANFTWSVFGNTGWSFGGGNNVIAQNTVRKMIISIGLPTAATWTMTNEVWTYSP